MRFWRWLFRWWAPKRAVPSIDSPYRRAANQHPGAPPPEPPPRPAPRDAPLATPSDPLPRWVWLAGVSAVVSLMNSAAHTSPLSDPSRPLPTTKLPTPELRAWDAPPGVEPYRQFDLSQSHLPATSPDPAWNAPSWSAPSPQLDLNRALRPPNRSQVHWSPATPTLQWNTYEPPAPAR